MYFQTLLLTFPALIYGKCVVNLDNKSGKYPPLLLQNGDFIYPMAEENGRIISIDSGNELQIYCHGSEKYQHDTLVELYGTTYSNSVTVQCSDDGKLINTESQLSVDVEAATCTRRQEPLIIRDYEICSPIGADGRTTDLAGNLVRASIGWNLPSGYQEQIGLCIDEFDYGTIWTNHTVKGAYIGLRDTSSGRPSFRIDTTQRKNFYAWTTSTGMNYYYKKTSQASQMEKILKTNVINGNPIITTDTRGTHYFAKGHLAPDAAFIYDVQQDATYYFMNVAPQFQSFNNGNWKALESNTRELASTLGRDLKVTTGTSGLLKYPDTEGNMQEIDLFTGSHNVYIPAPEYYWKVVEDPATRTAAAFIGLNDPHRDSKPVEVCQNRCSQMDWVDWSVDELDSGYMYCCSVEEARNGLPAIPDSIFAPNGLIGKTNDVVDVPATQAPSPPMSGDTCTAGPCTCTCTKNTSGVYTCTCTCNDNQ